LVNRCTR